LGLNPCKNYKKNKTASLKILRRVKKNRDIAVVKTKTPIA
jgi:hypothetical protein